MHEEGHVDDGTLTGPPTEHDVDADEPTRETPVVEASWIPPTPTPPVPPAGPEPPRRGRSWLAPALVGALVGAAVSGGIVAVAKDDGSTTSSPRLPAASTRNSSVLTKPSDIQGVLAKVEPAAVSVNTRGFEQGFFDVVPTQGAGTGMVISADGDVLTNAHVISGATNKSRLIQPGRDLLPHPI